MKWASNNWLIWVIVAILSLFLLGESTLVVGLIITAIIGRFVMVLGLERLVVLTLFTSLPFSLDLLVFSNSKMTLPSEAILLVLFFTFLFNVLQFPPEKLIKVKTYWPYYTLLFSSLFFIGTIAITSIFSTMPIISVKFLLVNLLFISVGLGYTFLLLQQQKILFREVLLAITIGLVLVVLYVLAKTTVLGFGRGVAPALPKPFFNDHTHLAATLLLIIPLVFYLWKTEQKVGYKRGFLLVFILFIVGLVITYSRASWMGGFVMLGMVFIWHFKVKKEVILYLSLIVILILAFNKSTIESYFQINRNDSNSSESGVGEQIKSVTNITSDVSNLERLNRWKCAVRMGLEKPIFGYGPGTYQFQYLPFQRINELTRISVKSPYYIKEGRGGTAHSEYLLSFSESGWVGLISWLFLIISVVYTFFRIVHKSSNKETILLAQAIFAGLVGFFIHAFFNNFMNTPNFALYFWFLIGLLLFISHQIRKEI
jgi:O-antigen ligase